MSSPYPNMLPKEQDFINFTLMVNIQLTDNLVFYDKGDGANAARVFWMFDTMGHPNIRVLNGGFKKWVAEKRPTESTPAPKERFAYKFNPDKYATFEQVQENLGKQQLIDTRPAKAYEDGHIEGAKNLPFQSLLKEDNSLKSVKELQDALEGLRIDSKQPIVSSCRTGMSASLGYLALRHAGIENAKVYDGSWTEYVSG